MIKSISIENFRSIKDKITFSFSMSNRIKHKHENYFKIGNFEISRSTVIYGSNASGKSNILKAFKALEFLILYSSRFAPNDKIVAFEPFLLMEGYENKPVKLGIDFFADNTRYEYYLEYTSERIEIEYLYFYPSNRKRALLFKRSAGEKIEFGEYFRGEKVTIGKMLLPNQLFLSKAAENNAESCLPIYNFFKQKLWIYPFPDYIHSNIIEFSFAQKIANEPNSTFSKKLNALLCALDTGIRSVSAKEIDSNRLNFDDNPHEVKSKIPRNIKRFDIDIITLHDFYDLNGNKKKGVYFDFEEESVGTRSLLSLGGIIIDALENGYTLVIDEFEKNLHPLITSYLVKLFCHPDINKKNAQLIFATHDVTLLSNDIFNRDQVWFTQKNDYGATELIRCSEIKGLRLKAPLDSWYLSGRLGGTAVINDVDFIMSMLNT